MSQQADLPAYFTKHAKYLVRDLQSGDPSRVAGAAFRIRHCIPELARAGTESLRQTFRHGDALKVVAAEQSYVGWREFSAALEERGDASEGRSILPGLAGPPGRRFLVVSDGLGSAPDA